MSSRNLTRGAGNPSEVIRQPVDQRPFVFFSGRKVLRVRSALSHRVQSKCCGPHLNVGDGNVTKASKPLFGDFGVIRPGVVDHGGKRCRQRLHGNADLLDLTKLNSNYRLDVLDFVFGLGVHRGSFQFWGGRR